MALDEKKFVNADFTGHLIAELQDNPASDGLSAAKLKAKFDYIATQIIAVRINQIIDAIMAETESDSGAHNVGSATIDGLTGNTVHAQISALKVLIEGLQVASVENVPDGSITDTKLSGAAADVKARFAAFAESHPHVVADIADLANVLEGYAALVHTHAISSVTGLQSALDSKSATTHLHTGTYQPAGNVATAAQGAKADAALPASSYTALDVLAKLLSVDGAGSGLNADVLDGYHSAAFVLTGYSDKGTHMDTVKRTSIYGMYGRPESPDGTSALGILRTEAYSPDWVIQWWYPVNSTNKSGYRRVFYSGTTWTNWVSLGSEVSLIYSSSTPTVVNGAIWLKPI